MIKTRLSVMMFLLLFTWGAWGATLGACLSAHGLADFTASIYGAGPLAAMIAPLFLGLVADRFFPSQIVFGVLMLVSAAMIYLAIGYAEEGNGVMVYRMFLAHMLCYMPTLGLANTIAFANLDDPKEFPAIRVWGTIAWICAGLLVGIAGWTASYNILWLTVIAATACGVYCFTLPHTPPPAKGEPINLKSLLMFDAFGMLAEPAFAVFIVCSTLICIPLAYYYAFTGNLLTTAGFEQAAATMTLGQMSEVVFMLLIPFFFQRLGVKWMILVGMVAWVARYLLFAFGAPDSVTWMLLLGVALHGICYDFFFVTGFIYSEQKAPARIRGQIQSLLVFFTQGVGMYLGFWFAGVRYGESVKDSDEALTQAISAARDTGEVSFLESFTKMFSQSIPESVDPALVTETMSNWQSFWTLPAYMAAAIAIIFFLAFWDRVDREAALADTAEDPPATEAAPA